jgi:hypothetical protein
VKRILLKLILPLFIASTALAGAQIAPGVIVRVDGEAVAFEGAPPTIRNGRVLVPLRGVFESLGAEVEWQPVSDTVIARRGARVVQLGVGRSTALVDGREVALETPPILLADTVLVPLRFIAEALGADVRWDPEARAVLIASGRN